MGIHDARDLRWDEPEHIDLSEEYADVAIAECYGLIRSAARRAQSADRSGAESDIAKAWGVASVGRSSYHGAGRAEFAASSAWILWLRDW